MTCLLFCTDLITFLIPSEMSSDKQSLEKLPWSDVSISLVCRLAAASQTAAMTVWSTAPACTAAVMPLSSLGAAEGLFSWKCLCVCVCAVALLTRTEPRGQAASRPSRAMLAKQTPGPRAQDGSTVMINPRVGFGSTFRLAPFIFSYFSCRIYSCRAGNNSVLQRPVLQSIRGLQPDLSFFSLVPSGVCVCIISGLCWVWTKRHIRKKVISKHSQF